MSKHDKFPLGVIPPELQRPELAQLAEAGYKWDNPHEVIHMFEQKVADFAGAKYAVAVDSCTNALFLVMKYLECKGTITIPSRTYISVPMQIKHAGCDVAFEDIQWTYQYQLAPYPIWDAAALWGPGMYTSGFQCISFQFKKPIPIGKGGMILTDDEAAASWLRVAAHDGRAGDDYANMQFKILGYHFNMTPEDAARGILLMDSPVQMPQRTPKDTDYTDVSGFDIFR